MSVRLYICPLCISKPFIWYKDRLGLWEEDRLHFVAKKGK